MIIIIMTKYWKFCCLQVKQKQKGVEGIRMHSVNLSALKRPLVSGTVRIVKSLNNNLNQKLNQ